VQATTQSISHRGASAYAPENTIASIKKATELGSKYIEIDVHMTKDGHVVALHDSTLDRTSNGSGNIHEFTLDELRKLDFGSWFNKDFKNEKIATLEEVMAIIQDDQILIIELKEGHETYNRIEERIVTMIRLQAKEKQMILKSFDLEILEKFKKIAPDIERLYCTFGGNQFITLDNFLRFQSIFKESHFKYLQVHKYFLNKELIQKAHKKGIKVVVWDVHKKNEMKEFIKLGVDFIETDNPDYLIELTK
jgi:glycerophosphoryl diester phosphodiesterase